MTRVNPIIFLSTVLIVCLAFTSPEASGRKDADERVKAIETGFAPNHLKNPGNTLEDYLAYAALNNPGLRAAFYQWKSQLEGIPAVSSLSNPVFSYGYFIENVETRVGPQNQRFSLKQKFPWFGTLGAKRDIASESAARSYQRFLSKKLALSLEIKETYYDYYLLGREIEITDASRVLLEYWESVARTRYKASMHPHHDLIRIQVEMGILEERLSSLKDRKKIFSARLKASLDLPDSTIIPVPDRLIRAAPPLEIETIKREIAANNPDLNADVHLIEREKANFDLARKESYPGFTFGIDYIETGDAIDPYMIDSGKDPWGVSFGIDLPIWFGKNSGRRKEVLARMEMVRYDFKNRKNNLLALAEKTLVEYRDAGRKIDLYGNDLITKTEQLLNVTFSSYQAGETDFLNVISVQRRLLDLQAEFEKARVTEAKKLAELELLTGRELR